MPDNPLNENPADVEAIPDHAIVVDSREPNDNAASDEGDFTPASGAARNARAGASSTAALEDRLKRGAQRFQFGALIDVPSRPPRPAKQHVRASVRPPAPAPVPSAAPEVPPAPSSSPTPSPTSAPVRAAAPSLVGPPTRRARAIGPALALGGAVIAALAAAVALQGRKAAAPSAGGRAQPATARSAGTSAAGAPAQSEARSPGLPDAALTPGERGASKGEARPAAIPEALRKQVLNAYGVGPDDKRTVVCRLIPASLGGATTARNLFPVTPWFADLKARLDAALTQEVQAGRMTAEQAATEETTNWVQAVHAHGIRNYGLMDANQARQKEQQLRW